MKTGVHSGLFPRKAVLACVVIGLVLRVLAVAGLDHTAPYAGTGGDSGWYLANGYALVTGTIPCPDAIRWPALTLPLRALAHTGQPVGYLCTETDVERLPTPPVYLLIVGLAQGVFGLQSTDAVLGVRIGQVIAGTLTIAVIAGLGWQLAGRRAAGLSAAITALHPMLIVETGQIVSETVFILLIAMGLLTFIIAAGTTTGTTADAGRSRAGQESARPSWMQIGGLLALCGLCFGLAALTRASVLAFPVLLIGGLLAHGAIHRSHWRQAVLGAGVLGLAYALTVGSWTAYNLIRYDRFVIAGEGIAAFLYVGATGWDDPEAVDARLAAATGEAAGEADQNDFIAAAGGAITADIGGYIQRRAGELAAAALQPHGTAYYTGPSLREAVAGWWGGDRTLAGLRSLTAVEGFWPKLALYIAHYGVIALASVGLAAGFWRRNTTATLGSTGLTLAGWPLYLLAVHLPLLALPRYLFPGIVGLLPLAATGLRVISASSAAIASRMAGASRGGRVESTS